MAYDDYLENMTRNRALPTRWATSAKEWLPPSYRIHKNPQRNSGEGIDRPGFFTPFEKSPGLMGVKQAGRTMGYLLAYTLGTSLYNLYFAGLALASAVIDGPTQGIDHVGDCLKSAGASLLKAVFLPVFYAIELVKEVLAFFTRGIATLLLPANAAHDDEEEYDALGNR